MDCTKTTSFPIWPPFWNHFTTNPWEFQNTKPPNTWSFFNHFNKLTVECDFDFQNSSIWVCLPFVGSNLTSLCFTNVILFFKTFQQVNTISLGVQFNVIKFCGCDFHRQNPVMMHFGIVTMKFNVCDLVIQRQFWWIMIWKSRNYFDCLFMSKCECCVCVGSFFKEWQAF